MLLKLPIIIENKIIFTLFKLTNYKTYYLLSLFQNNSDVNNVMLFDKISNDIIIKILLLNNVNGYEIFNLYLPLKLFIIDNQLISLYFYMINFCLIIDNTYDFFNSLNFILKNKINLELIKKINYNKYQDEIFTFINNQYLQLISNKKYNKEFWEIINLLLNSSIYILHIININNINIINCNILKKIQNIANIFKNIKYSIDYSNKYTFNEHLLNIKNNEVKLNDLINDYFYFLLIDNKKNLLVKIESKQHNFVKLYNFNNSIDYNNYKWYKYSPNTSITENKIFFNIFFNTESLYNIINKFNPKISNINNIIDYFLKNRIKSNLFTYILENNNNDEEKTDINIIKSNSFTIDFFKSICIKYELNYYLILNTLFYNYTYPVKYNKKEIDPLFDNILYISLINIHKILLSDKNANKIYINPIIIIPNKLKLLYLNILKIFNHLIYKNKENIIYFYDSYYIQFIKILLYSNSLTFELLKKKVLNDDIINLKKKLTINFTIYDIINRIKWCNINNRLYYLKYLLNNKEYLFFHDKLNKNIFGENFDNRLKNIIINPIEMFKYLRKECDFIKWILFLENNYNNLYYNNISLKSNEFEILGKIIFCLLNIKEQKFTDKYYNKLISYGIKHPKIIIDNNRINLKIKENFNYFKCNINLGILAKNLTYNKNNYIELNNDNEINELNILKKKINIITNKYLKYKKKYFNIKNNDEQKI